MTPRLVGEELMPSAVALNQVHLADGRARRPGRSAALVIARSGFGSAYAIDLVDVRRAVRGGVADAADAARPTRPRERRPGWAAVKEGFAFVRRNRLIQSTFVIDLIAMIFGLPRALFTFLAVTQFHRGPEVVGLLFAARPWARSIGALTAGWVETRAAPRDRPSIWAVVAWGAAIAAFGLVGANLPLALLFLARRRRGRRDLGDLPFHDPQLETPDRLRGRMSRSTSWW